MSSVIIALVVGVFAGALVLWLATRGQGNPAVLQSQGEIKGSIDFTVCFVPAEDLLAAAYREHPGLFYDAVRDRVLIATPATLMALLWGVAYGWQQDARARQAQQVGDIAADLHQRFALTMRHLQKTGRSLSTAVNSYNALVGSLESRVLPQLRRLEELGIVAYGTQVPQAQTVEAQPRPVPSAPDPLEGAEP